MAETIIYIGGELPDKDASALRIVANCRALREGGYNVIVISPSKDTKRLADKTEIVEGFKVHYLPYPQSAASWFYDLVASKPYIDIIKTYDNVKGVICYNHHAISLLRLTNYLHSKGIKVYADCTEWHTTSHLPFIKRIAKSLNTKWRINWAQKKTDGIISISQFFADLYSDHKNVIIVPPLIDIQNAIWDHRPQKNQTRTFSYTGRPGIGKDLLTDIIYSFKSINDKYNFIFRIVGSSKEEYLAVHPEDKEVLESLGSKIQFQGYCSHIEAVRVTQESDFSFLIRDHNRKNDSGFPTKLAESVACGTPVIATDFSNVKYYIEKHGLGMMINKERLTDAIVNAIQMPQDELDTMKERCRNCKAFDFRNYIEVLCGFVKL